MNKFVNRQEELDFLKDNYNSTESDLIVIYGRRRIGKSKLARESLKRISEEKRNKAIYYQATETTPQTQLEEFIEVVEKTFPEVKSIRKDWEPILKFLGEKGPIVIIDEFPYLIVADKSIPSKFQRVWDRALEDSAIKLFLIGSSISVMKDKVLSGGSPLHGRRTGQLDLKPLSFEKSKKFFSDYSPKKKILTWSVFGGTPHYLQSLDSNKPIQKNIEDLILAERGLLREEPEFILRAELEKPNRYLSILKAISKGKTKRNEIAQEIGVESSPIGSYLSKLRTLRIIEREVPVTSEPPKSRSGIFQVREPLFRFWFRFVYGKEDQIELADHPYQQIVEPELNDYVSPHFESLCQIRLPELVPSNYKKIGRWWYKDNEIDVVGLTDHGKILGECKYSNSRVDKRTLANLERKEEKIKVGGDTEYVLFSKSGFSPGLEQEEREREDLYLFDLKQIISSKSSSV